MVEIKRTSFSNGSIYEEEIFLTIDSNQQILVDTEFKKCTFTRCNFSETQLSQCYFDSCIFRNCNFNTAKLKDTSLLNCTFADSTFIGVDFSQLKTLLSLEITFSRCNLGFCVLSGMKIRKSSFNHCILEEADFSESELKECSFLFADLTRTIFHHTKMTDLDLRGAKNYQISPVTNSMKNTVLSMPEAMALFPLIGIRIEESPDEAEK